MPWLALLLLSGPVIDTRGETVMIRADGAMLAVAAPGLVGLETLSIEILESETAGALVCDVRPAEEGYRLDCGRLRMLVWPSVPDVEGVFRGARRLWVRVPDAPQDAPGAHPTGLPIPQAPPDPRPATRRVAGRSR
jgi:hypothetical protein